MRLALGSGAKTCPLTVIGGFLGAGKTTFLNRLLANARGRYAVLVNDFGAVNVDAGLVTDHDGTTMRLTNGCVCCSLSDGFFATLLRVIGEDPPFDHLVIEASGVGDPWAIAEIAIVEPRLMLDSVVIIADAERIESLVGDERLGDVVSRQIRAADIVLLNKVDLVDGIGRAAARDAVAGVHPDARIVETVGAMLPDDVIDLRRTTKTAGRWRAEEVQHEERFTRFAYRRRGALELASLPIAMAGLPPSLLRLKGVCAVSGEPDPQILQVVGRRWSLATAPSGLQGEWPIELIGIGLDLNPDEIDPMLDDALAITPGGRQ